MHPIFPCPNPACTHTFSPQAIQGVSSLVCPKCGTIFQFASGAPTVKRPAPSKAPPRLPKIHLPPAPPPTAAVPIAEPVTPPEAPLAVPDGAAQTAASFNFDSTADLATPTSRRAAGKRGHRRRGGWIMAIAFGILVPTLAVWGGLWLIHFYKQNKAQDEAAGPVDNPYNSRFNWPSKPWTRDKDLERRFNVHIGMRSPQHDNGMALLFKDYKTRLPSTAEMLDEAVAKLRSYFKGLEWELQSKDGQARLADHAAQVLRFQGDDADQVMMNGECYMLAYRGYGYWFFTWAPFGELESDGDAIRGEWERLRQGISLREERKGWKAKPRLTEIVTGKKAKYRLGYVKGLWTNETSGAEDPLIDLLLRGQEPDPERRPLAGKDATVQVLILPRQADLKSATAATLAYIKEGEKKLYERTSWEPIKDKNGDLDRDASIGTESGHTIKLHVKNTEDLERFLSIAVVNRPEGVIVLIGDCLWERRDFWDQELTALFSSFTIR